MNYVNFNMGVNFGAGHSYMPHHGSFSPVMPHYGGFHHFPTHGAHPSFNTWNVYNGMCGNMIGRPYYGYRHDPFAGALGGIMGATAGAGFGGMLGLGLSHGDPGWGLIGTLLGTGLGFAAGRNIGRHGMF